MKGINRTYVLVIGVLLIADAFALSSRAALTRRAALAEGSLRMLSTTRVLDEADLSTLLRRLGATVYNTRSDWASTGSEDKIAVVPPEGGPTPAVVGRDRGIAKLLEVRDSFLGRPRCECSTLFVFFSPTDCGSCLRAADNWQRLANGARSDGLVVAGVVDSYDLADISEFLKALKIRFPVILDRPGLLRSYFSIQETPTSILLDARGNLVAVSPKTVNPNEMREFEDAVRKAAREAR